MTETKPDFALPPRLAWTTEEFAELIGLRVDVVRRLTRSGELEWVSGGKCKLIPFWAAHKFLRTPPEYLPDTG